MEALEAAKVLRGWITQLGELTAALETAAPLLKNIDELKDREANARLASDAAIKERDELVLGLERHKRDYQLEVERVRNAALAHIDVVNVDVKAKQDAIEKAFVERRDTLSAELVDWQSRVEAAKAEYDSLVGATARVRSIVDSVGKTVA